MPVGSYYVCDGSIKIFLYKDLLFIVGFKFDYEKQVFYLHIHYIYLF